MSPPLNDVFVSIILTLIHILAIVYTIKMGKVFNSKSWNFIIAAFIILLAKRIITFLVLFGSSQYSGAILLFDRFYIPILFWILIAIGMIKMYYKINSSMDIEKRIKRATKHHRKKRPY